MQRTWKLTETILLLTVLAFAANAEDQPVQPPESGGELTVLLDASWTGSWPAGLDPATNTTGRANLSIMNAIYGGLFQVTARDDGTDSKITGVLATGYEVADGGKTLIIRLREGVKFSDGTPFDAEAVRFNIERNLRSPCTCTPTDWPWDMQRPVTTPDEHTVALHFVRAYAPSINAFPVTSINWIASPTALNEMGESKFRIAPVGAGPFRVVSNMLSTRLVLERNPLYWDADRPYLDRLVFQSINSEQAAYQALVAGDAQVYEGMTSTPLIDLAMKNSKLAVTFQPATSPYVIQLNTLRGSLNDERARQAIYYATDVNAIVKGLANDRYPPTQSFTAPGGLFFHQETPGYRAHDLAKAQELVKELGGLQIKLGTIRLFAAEQVATALQSQWQKAGIEVSLESYELSAQIKEFQAGSWQAMLMTVGSYDPEGGIGVSLRFRSDGTYTGVRDAALDRILADAAGTFDAVERDALYLSAAKHISDNAYAPFLFAAPRVQVSARGYYGPGLTTKIPPIVLNSGILWSQVWRKSGEAP